MILLKILFSNFTQKHFLYCPVSVYLFIFCTFLPVLLLLLTCKSMTCTSGCERMIGTLFENALCVHFFLLKIPHSNFIFKKEKNFYTVQSPATRFDVTVNMRKHDMYLYF